MPEATTPATAPPTKPAGGYLADDSSVARVGDIGVQVCYAPPPPATPLLHCLSVPVGTTLAEALARSGLEAYLPPEALAGYRTGIWGKLRPGDTVLRETDRIEIYRPLLADPKESRRRRAKSAAGRTAG